MVRELRELARPLPADPLARRDADFIRRHLEILGPLVDAWFAPECDGLAHLPRGRALVVGTHNGGFISPDLFSFMVGVWRTLGTELPTYGLTHDVAFRIPGMAPWLSKLGAVPARPDLALELLQRDRLLAVFPGGVRDAYKPYRARGVVDFYGRTGFLRTAIRAGAPIVPLVSAGAHEAIYVLAGGARAAHALGLDARLRLDALPLQLCLPWGIAVGPVPYVPMPCKVRLRLLPPIELGLPPEAADDPGALAGAYRRVVGAMQVALDELISRGDAGLRGRIRGRLRGALRTRVAPR
jgi:1-acyl-sn-glycerol-3-phosphate acyltransferase